MEGDFIFSRKSCFFFSQVDGLGFYSYVLLRIILFNVNCDCVFYLLYLKTTAVYFI